MIRDGAEQFIEEAERSINDEIMIIRRALKAASIEAGGGALEMELSKYIREEGMKISVRNYYFLNVANLAKMAKWQKWQNGKNGKMRQNVAKLFFLKRYKLNKEIL